MADFDDTNKFALFPNKDKGADDERDYTGYINIDGKKYWLNGYNRASGVVGGYVKPQKEAVADTQSGYEKAKAQADDLRQEPINLGDIPF